MTLKFICITLFALITLNAFAQKDVLRLVINGEEISKKSETGTPEIIAVDKVKYKKTSYIILILKRFPVNTVYKRSLQITDTNENPLQEISEQKSKVGWFKISLIKIRPLLLKQEIIKVFLLENPANDMMKLPSRKKLLTELHFR